MIGKGHPYTYVFSPDPIAHSRAIFIFRPMIFVSGGQLESQWDIKSPEEKLQSRYEPMYPDVFTEDSIYALDRWSPRGSERPNKGLAAMKQDNNRRQKSAYFTAFR